MINRNKKVIFFVQASYNIVDNKSENKEGNIMQKCKTQKAVRKSRMCQNLTREKENGIMTLLQK